MKKLLKIAAMMILILVVSIFPVFMSPTRSIWDAAKEDEKKVAEQVRDVEKVDWD